MTRMFCRIKMWPGFVAVPACVLAGIVTAFCAAEPAGVSAVTAPASTNLAENEQIEIKADRSSVDRRTGWAEGVGHVRIKKGSEQLTADHIKVNIETEEAEAVGDVVLYRIEAAATGKVVSARSAAGTHLRGRAEMQEGSRPTTNVVSAPVPVVIWRGNKLRYNFKTHMGDMENMTYNMTPFTVRAKTVQQVSTNEFVVKESTITTCTNAWPDYHYYVKSDEAEVYMRDRMVAHSSSLYFEGIPIFYFPYWVQSLDGDGFRFYPGYNSRMGAFLLSMYKYRIDSDLSSQTHLDYRTKRGVAFGEDLLWSSTNQWKGDISAYYLKDNDPLEDGTRNVGDVKSDRYRIELKHQQSFSDRDYFLSQGQYLSDPYLNMDFFEDEYREQNQPDNFMAFTHRGDDFSANLLMRSRLNDFYSTVNRLPEASFDFMRQEVGDSIIYYEGKTAAAFLQKTYEKANTNDHEYSAFRLDSAHMFYIPQKYFGFLNVTPRAGYDATFYSETRTVNTTVTTGLVSVASTTVDASGHTNITYSNVLSTNTTTTTQKGQGELRNRFELGLETSFKAFKTWDDDSGGWRHVVEPYANYTMVPEPNILPDHLYQFDEVDSYVKENFVKLGTRNKLQTKMDGVPTDVADVDIYTRYLFELGNHSNAVDNFNMDAKFWPADHVTLFFDGMYDTDLKVLSVFNSRLNFSSADFYNFYLEHRYTYQASSLLNSSISLSPNKFWTFEVYGRYEFETKHFEEEWFYVSKKIDCMTFRTGVGFMPGYTASNGAEVKDEVRVAFEVWLNAFPGMNSSNHRN